MNNSKKYKAEGILALLFVLLCSMLSLDAKSQDIESVKKGKEPAWFVQPQVFGGGSAMFTEIDGGSMRTGYSLLLIHGLEILRRTRGEIYYGIGGGVIYRERLDLDMKYHHRLFASVGISRGSRFVRILPQLHVGIQKGMMDYVPHIYGALSLCLLHSRKENRFSFFFKPSFEIYSPQVSTSYSSYRSGSHGSGPTVYNESVNTYNGRAVFVSLGFLINISPQNKKDDPR